MDEGWARWAEEELTPSDMGQDVPDFGTPEETVDLCVEVSWRLSSP